MSSYRICMSLSLKSWQPLLTPCETADGRAWFTVPNLFEASICLRGGNQDDGWFFVHVEFLFTVGGDRTGMQGPQRNVLPTLYSQFMLHVEFPRKPTGVLKDHLTIEADNRLGCYLPMPEPEKPPDLNLPAPTERPKLPEDVIDAPLVRIYNFLRKCYPWSHLQFEKLKSLVEMMSMSYQLEILWYQVFFFAITMAVLHQ